MMRAFAVMCLFAFGCFADTSLDGNWSLASSAEVHETGDVISKKGYDSASWVTAKVPATVMAALVSAKVVSDPDFGMNLRDAPGMHYPSGYNLFDHSHATRKSVSNGLVVSQSVCNSARQRAPLATPGRN